MNARNKLNVAYVYGAMIVASLVGVVAQSWTVFFVALIVLLVGSFVAGQIRPKRRR